MVGLHELRTIIRGTWSVWHFRFSSHRIFFVYVVANDDCDWLDLRMPRRRGSLLEITVLSSPSRDTLTGGATAPPARRRMCIHGPRDRNEGRIGLTNVGMCGARQAGIGMNPEMRSARGLALRSARLDRSFRGRQSTDTRLCSRSLRSIGTFRMLDSRGKGEFVTELIPSLRLVRYSPRCTLSECLFSHLARPDATATLAAPRFRGLFGHRS